MLEMFFDIFAYINSTSAFGKVISNTLFISIMVVFYLIGYTTGRRDDDGSNDIYRS